MPSVVGILQGFRVRLPLVGPQLPPACGAVRCVARGVAHLVARCGVHCVVWRVVRRAWHVERGVACALV